jgi:hypothetical protein
MSDSELKLSALKGRAFRHGGFLYIVPLDPALEGGDCGVLSVQRRLSRDSRQSIIAFGINNFPLEGAFRITLFQTYKYLKIDLNYLF